MDFLKRLRSAVAPKPEPTTADRIADAQVEILEGELERQREERAEMERAAREVSIAMVEAMDQMDPIPPTCDELMASPRYEQLEREWVETRDGTAKRLGLELPRGERPRTRGRQAEAITGFGDPDDKVVGRGGGHSLQFRRVAKEGEFAIPVEMFRAITQARHLNFKSPLVAACHKVRARATKGEGYTVVSDNPKVQALLDAFRADPYNELVNNVEELDKRLNIDGQLVLPLMVTPTEGKQKGGRVRVRRWDPRDVASISFEDDNAYAPEHLRLVGAAPPTEEFPDPDRDTESIQRSDDDEATAVWRVVRRRDDPDEDWDEEEEGPQPFRSTRPGTGYLDGDVIWARANTDISDIGMPTGVEGFHVADQWDLVQAQTTRAVRLKTIYALSVKAQGFTPGKLSEFQKNFKLPKLGGSAIWFGNENMEVANVPFDLGTADIEEHLRSKKIVVLMGFGLVPSAMGEEQDSTYAGAMAAATPMRNALLANQENTKRVLEQIFQFVVETGALHQVETEEGTLSDSDELDFEVVMDEISADDAASAAARFQTLLGATTAAFAAGVIGQEEAQAAAHWLFEDAGVLDFDEIKNAREKPALPLPGQSMDEPTEADDAKIASILKDIEAVGY